MTESNKPTEAEQSADLQFTISLSPENLGATPAQRATE